MVSSTLLTSSRREYYWFSRSPMQDYFQWKIRKNFLPLIYIFFNETKSRHPNFCKSFSLTFRELNGYFLKLRSSFFRTIRPLASSVATAYYQQVPSRTDGIPERDERPRDNGYKSVFTNSWLVRQRHRSWIKGLGTNPQKEWTRSLLAVPFVRGHPTVTPQTPRNDGMYTRQPPWWHTTCGMFTSLPAKTHKNRNACIDALRSVAQK